MGVEIMDVASYNPKRIYPKSMYDNTCGDLIQDVSPDIKLKMCARCGEYIIKGDTCPFCGCTMTRNISCSQIFSVIDNTRMSYFKTLAETKGISSSDYALAA